MVNEQVLEGKWNEIQGQLRDRWGQLSKDELEQFDGNVQQLVGMIQRKTGVARDKIESYLDELTNSENVQQAKEKVQEYAQQISDTVGEYATEARETVREGMQSAKDSARAGYVQTERLVRQKPVESLAVCFGAGLITGVVAGLMLRSK
ncbi:MAG: DUF883 family protein [Planctomycetaceae bacterium]|nr:DUF883 family protein [Planctomycetales bacterium]MCB9875798.1 DUF883 family protein [Planctomycetaceae bacterium]MCB9940645.1 DUF883 family protein [Planctomycetaceae bacterium]HRX77980.1 CsbD family protein [Pirellulaceae bacterium]